MNARRKGLNAVRRVKKYLESLGYNVEGPGYSIMFLQGDMRPYHKDYFGVFDLLTVSPTENIRGHQICSEQNKARNVKKILDANLSGYLWTVGEHNKCKQYWVSQDGVELLREVKLTAHNVKTNERSYNYNMTEREIAKEIGCSQQNVNRIIKNALNKLRDKANGEFKTIKEFLE